MIKFIAEFFIISILLFTLLIILTSSNGSEFSVEMAIYISLVTSIFNVVFVSVLEFLKISNFREWPKKIIFIEIVLYYLLIWMIRGLIEYLDIATFRNPLADFPFTFIYPFIVVFIFCLFCKKWYLGRNVEGIENEDILDSDLTK